MRWLLWASLWCQSPSMEELIEKFSNEALEKRTVAQEKVLEKWREWGEGDLLLLAKAERSRDVEVASIAANCLGQIRLFRTIPDRTWLAFPSAGPTLSRGTPDQVRALLESARKKWEGRQLQSRDVIPLLIPVLLDRRECDKGSLLSHEAKRFLGAVIPRFSGDVPQSDIVEWWSVWKDKPEREWYEPDLRASSEQVRAGAIRRLLSLDIPETFPGVFAALKSIDGDHWFSEALNSETPLPGEVIRRELTPYLLDPRLEARFVAARLLYRVDPSKAIVGLVAAIKDPAQLRNQSLRVPCLREALAWLAEANREAASDAFRHLLSAEEYEVKSDVMAALEILGDTGASVVVESLWDKDSSGGYEEWKQMRNPRICDKAGTLLAAALGVAPRFVWDGTLEQRDENLRDLWVKFRESRNLPSVPFLPQGVHPVDEATSHGLIQSLLAGDAQARRVAEEKLSRLGMAAWDPLIKAAAREEGVKRERLDGVLLTLSNALTSVKGNAIAQDTLRKLDGALYHPLDLDGLWNAVVKPWFGNPQLSEIRIELKRQPDGRGIRLTVTLAQSVANAREYDELFCSALGARVIPLDERLFEQEWKDYGEEVRTSLGHWESLTYRSQITMRKQVSSARQPKPEPRK